MMAESNVTNNATLFRSIAHVSIAIIRHPLSTLAVGVGLLLGGAVELIEDIVVDFDSVIAAYHGMILLGVITALRGFADFAEGIERLSRKSTMNEPRQ